MSSACLQVTRDFCHNVPLTSHTNERENSPLAALDRFFFLMLPVPNLFWCASSVKRTRYRTHFRRNDVEWPLDHFYIGDVALGRRTRNEKKNDSGKERFRTIRRDVGGYLKTNNKPWTRCKISSFTYCPITFTERETHQEEHPINLGDNMHNTHSGRKKIKSKRRKLPRVSGYSNTTTSPANFLRHHS